MPTNSRNHETIVLHSGYRSDPTTTAVALPIYQTTSYQFSSTEHGGNLFALKELGNIYTNTMGTMGIECRFAPADPENFRRATDARTRCYYGETLPNPKLAVFPIAEVAKIGRELGVPLIMDNTACPVLCQPIEHVPRSSCTRQRSTLAVTVPRLEASSSMGAISTGRNTLTASPCSISRTRATTERFGRKR